MGAVVSAPVLMLSAALNRKISPMVLHFPIFHAESQVPTHVTGSVHLKQTLLLDLFIASGGRIPVCCPGQIPIRVLPAAPS